MDLNKLEEEQMKKRILVVEDEVRILLLIKKRLEFAGYDVITAMDGNSGMMKARSEKPDLIVLDLILPGLNGYQVCAMLKGDKQSKDIPILMLTARSQEKDITEGIRVGADAYMTKPYDPEAFTSQVQFLLKQMDEHRVEKERIEHEQNMKQAAKAEENAEKLGKFLKR
jgi:two-component system, OmpR family, alkaline phosphatase synthesis response regulator PhoP